MNTRQLALIKKDIRSITSNKQVLMVMLMVPLALTIVLPSVLVLVTVMAPDSASDFHKMLSMVSFLSEEPDQQQVNQLVNGVLFLNRCLDDLLFDVVIDHRLGQWFDVKAS